MKIRTIAALAVASFLAVGGFAAAQYSSANYMTEGGSYWGVGGTLDVVSGGALKIAGTDKTSALSAAVTTPVAGVAASYKIARGENALDGSNPTDIATGLTTVVACSASIKTSTAPNLNTAVVTYTTSSATLNLYAWKPTSEASPNLTASTTTETIGWLCIGT